jgi:hypothetical protein
MSAALCELNPAIREFLASLPPGTVIAQLADGSLAICRSEGEADRLIVASRGAVEGGTVKGGKSPRKSRSLEPNRASQLAAVQLAAVQQAAVQQAAVKQPAVKHAVKQPSAG